MHKQNSFAKSIPMFLLSVLAAVSSPAATQIVTSLADDGSPGTLRSVLSTASAGDTVTFNVTGTITLTQGQLEISKNLTISGPGASTLNISGNDLSRVFYVDPAISVAVSGVTISHGHLNGVEGGGGGIYNSGNLNLADVAVSNNSAGYAGYGGGLYTAPGSSTNLTRTTISGNYAQNYGGAMFIQNNSWVYIKNSTIFANSAYDAGIAWILGSLSLINTTVANNTANNSPTFIGYVYLKNTILSKNTGGFSRNCRGYELSLGHNLSDDDSCAPFLTQVGDLNNTAAGLDPKGLQNNGGLTQTVALLPGSAAVDAIPLSPNNYCTDRDGITPVSTDQRGVTRPQGSACDIGAFELVQLPPADLGILKGAPSQVETGKSLTYGLGVVNFGPGPATSVKIRDVLPAGTTFVAAFVGQGACSVVNGQVTGCSIPNQPVPCTLNGGVVTCAIDHLDAYTQSHPTGGVALITLQVSAPPGTTLVNTGQVSAANPDPNTANNSSSVATQVTGEK